MSGAVSITDAVGARFAQLESEFPALLATVPHIRVSHRVCAGRRGLGPSGAPLV
jgi:hypothetical protein